MAAKVDHVEPVLSRSSRDSILKPLSFPDPKNDASCFYDKEKDVPIPCLVCEASFGPEETSDKARELFKQHLFKEHNIVIHNTETIISYKCYAEYWKKRCSEASNLSHLFPVIQTNPTSPSSKSDLFYLISDALPEDKELRLFIQRQRLDAVLQVQQRERLDDSFNRGCLFCTERFTGNRTVLFNHMASFHSFNIGSPDNIVFVDEYLDLLQSKLDSLSCLYCERIFRDQSTLRDHMRKKHHRKIDPHNKQYDKYYIINYLEAGKTWEDFEREEKEDTLRHSFADEEWNEVEECPSPIYCLFCSITKLTLNSLNAHMAEQHQFNLLQVTTSMSYYQRIKIVNFIRRQVYQNVCMHCLSSYGSREALVQHMKTEKHFSLPNNILIWNQPQYLFPTYENDTLLCLLESD